jgi:hypothetical protein
MGLRLSGLTDGPFLDFHLWWKRCSTTITYFNNCFLRIREFQVNSASEGRGGFLLGLVCYFVGPLQGDPLAGVDEDLAGMMA